MKIRQKIGIILLVVYAFFFASANLFYHTHQLADGTIVHSHIFWGSKAHSHSTSQLQIIDLFNYCIYDNAETIEVQQIIKDYSEEIYVVSEVAAFISGSLYSFTLRAPPSF